MRDANLSVTFSLLETLINASRKHIPIPLAIDTISLFSSLYQHTPSWKQSSLRARPTHPPHFYIIMSFLVAVSLAFLCSAINASIVGDSDSKLNIQTNGMGKMQQIIRQNERCRAHICFAIDGSASIPASEFELAKSFVHSAALQLLVVGANNTAAAVQYGRDVTPIIALTGKFGEFSRAVLGTEQENGGDKFLIGALNYCMFQLSNVRRTVLNIVILGDGRDSSVESSVTQTDLFRKAFGAIVTVVPISSPNRANLLALAGGDEDLVFEFSGDNSSLIPFDILSTLFDFALETGRCSPDDS